MRWEEAIGARRGSSSALATMVRNECVVESKGNDNFISKLYETEVSSGHRRHFRAPLLALSRTATSNALTPSQSERACF